MYGYLQVEKSLLTENEYSLYRAFLCGLCVSTKNIFGNLPRLTLSFDLNFFNVLFHSICDINAEIETKHCILSPIKKHSMQCSDELTDLVSAGSLLMVYLKLEDDIVDSGSIAKKSIKSILKPFVSKASNVLPGLEKVLSLKYNDLRNLEKQNCTALDEVCDVFASMSSVFASSVLKDKSNARIESLCYNLGKWIYLIDALDDLKQDIKRKQYNPLIACFYDKTYTLNAESFIKVNAENLEYTFYATLNSIARDFNDLELQKYRCLLVNVIYHSLRSQTDKLLSV